MPGSRWSDSTAVRATGSSALRFLKRCATFLGDSEGSSALPFLKRCATFLGDSENAGDGVRGGIVSLGSM